MWQSLPCSSLTRAAYLDLMQSPEHILVCLPFAATLKDLVLKDRPSWTWMERAGFGSALFTATAGCVAITASQTRNLPLLPQSLANLSMWAGWRLASFAIACFAVRGLGSFWKSCAEPEPGAPSTDARDSVTADS